MKAKDILKILHNDGWHELERKATSHIQLKHPTKKGKVTVPFHGSKDIAPATINTILKQAGLK
jgi:predicted RNA binding protein YcfA (HicA-like mRNA interferase family)